MRIRIGAAIAAPISFTQHRESAISKNMNNPVFLLTAILGVLVSTASPASSTEGVLLTAATADTCALARPLTEQDELGDSQNLEAGDNGNCSILLDQNAVVEICSQTQVSFGKDSKLGNRFVNIESGTLKLIVEPREPSERIEIRTPVATATILGTVVFVSVDRAIGATTIASSQGQVSIRSRESGLRSETTISAFEQLTIHAAETHQKKEISEQQLDEFGSCLLDFHKLALKADRLRQETEATQRLVAADIIPF